MMNNASKKKATVKRCFLCTVYINRKQMPLGKIWRNFNGLAMALAKLNAT